jgi:hypothetical protein
MQAKALITASVRKKVAYRAEKAGMTTDEWKSQNPEMLAKITAASEKKVTVKHSFTEEITTGNPDTLLLPPEKLRAWNPNIPIDLQEHMQQSIEGLNHLTSEEKQALELYRGHAHEDINGALTGRSQIKFNSYYTAGHWKTSTITNAFHDFEDFKNYVNHMDSALSGRQTESRVIYRGVSSVGAYKIASSMDGSQVNDPELDASKANVDDIKAALMSHYEPGTEIQFDGYASTSLDPLVAAVWAGSGHGKPAIIYELQTSLGSDVTGISDFGGEDEREVILPRSSRFKVVNVYTDSKYSCETAEEGNIEEASYTDGNTVIVQLIEVNAEGNPVTTNEPFKPAELTEEALAERLQTSYKHH